MTNREKYGEQILDFICKNGALPGFADEKFISCIKLKCSECSFSTGHGCRGKMTEWLNSEYVEPETDWSKVPVDTKVLVRDRCEDSWEKRYFAGTDSGGKLIVFSDGKASWTRTGLACWNHIKLADPEDVEKYAKKSEDSK